VVWVCLAKRLCHRLHVPPLWEREGDGGLIVRLAWVCRYIRKRGVSVRRSDAFRCCLGQMRAAGCARVQILRRQMVHSVRDVATTIPDVSRLGVMCGRGLMCCRGHGCTVVGRRSIRMGRLRFVRWGVEARSGSRGV